jgi:hypothetical protein
VKRIIAVHDEIQPQRGPSGHPFLVHGVLFLPWEKRSYVAERLKDLRQGHTHQIEYRDIKSEHSPNFKVADRWLKWFKSEGVSFCTFKVFAIDQEGFRPFPYRGDSEYPSHIWRNTLSSFVAGITWTLGHPKGILLDVICDSSGDKDFLDALETLPRDLRMDFFLRRQRQAERSEQLRLNGQQSRLRQYPMVRVRGKVQTLSSNPMNSEPGFEEETEFIQLTDVLLGSIWDAVIRRQASERGRAGRLRLRREWVKDEQSLLAWDRRLPLFRKVSVSIYPDENGFAYPATVLTTRPGQQRFEFYDQLLQSKSLKKRLERAASQTYESCEMPIPVESGAEQSSASPPDIHKLVVLSGSR